MNETYRPALADSTSCVTLSKLPNFSVPQMPHQENGDHHGTFLSELLRRLNEVM